MNPILQVSLAFLGSLGFAIMFHVKGIKLIFCALGGAFTMTVFLLVQNYSDSLITGIFFAAFLTSLLAEVLARQFKAPVIMFLVPMLIPLIPGSDLYYTTSYLIAYNIPDFISRLALLAQKVGAIASGIILMASLVQIMTDGKRSAQNRIEDLKNTYKKGRPSD